MAEQKPAEPTVNPYAPLTPEETAAQENRILTAIEGQSKKTSQPTYSPVIQEVFSGTEPATSVPHKLGSNDSVSSGLSRISFLPGGGMSESIAYIRYWSRAGSQEKSSIDKERLNSYAETKPDLTGFYEGAKSTQNLTEVNPYTNNSMGFSGITTSITDTSKIQLYGVNPADNSIPSTSSFSETAKSSPNILPPGEVYSANPGGSVEITPAETPEGAVWQFLFNPEELEMSYGPEFNRGETWGVSDPANSGQPLSWRNNKNRKLSFSRILLHGYSIGRRVDALEKGLQQLFIARDGNNGADGPPVLEFVWGNRTFGPCVIQNIVVREKAWDRGLLVNAEVSFELEQVPEWTINDGFVDILRPGRQPVVNDPTVASEEYREAGQQSASGDQSGSTGDDEGGERDANSSGGGGGSTQSTSVLYKKCKLAKTLQDAFRKKADRVRNWRALLRELTYQIFRPFTSIGAIVKPEYMQYKSSYEKAEEGLGQTFISKIPSDWRIEAVSNRIKKQIKSEADIEFIFTQIRIACEKAEAACKNIHESQECVKSIRNESRYEQNVRRQRLCGLKAGDACPKGSRKGGRVVHPCTKKEYICDKNYRLA